LRCPLQDPDRFVCALSLHQYATLTSGYGEEKIEA